MDKITEQHGSSDSQALQMGQTSAPDGHVEALVRRGNRVVPPPQLQQQHPRQRGCPKYAAMEEIKKAQANIQSEVSDLWRW